MLVWYVWCFLFLEIVVAYVPNAGLALNHVNPEIAGTYSVKVTGSDVNNNQIHLTNEVVVKIVYETPQRYSKSKHSQN